MSTETKRKKSETLPENPAPEMVELPKQQPSFAPTMTAVEQVKLAVSIPNTTSQTLHSKDFTLLYDSSKACLYVQKKQTERETDKHVHPKFVIFSSNIAYMKI